MYIQSLVLAVDECIACQWSVVEAAAGVVEAPVFLDAISSVGFALHGVVPPAGAARCDFEHEVRRLANLTDNIAVARDYTFRIDTECHHAVGSEAFRVIGRFVSQVAFARNEHVVPVREESSQHDVKGNNALGLLHIRLTLRIGQRLQMSVIGNLRSECASSGHGMPL